MKLIHISDLHLGKRLNEFSLLQEQEHILGQILSIVEQEQPQAVLVAGDVYDKSIPSAEAVELCDRFLVALQSLGVKVFVISGNHDSPERLAFGGRLMEQSGVYISPVYGGTVRPIVLQDDYGPVNFYLLPFIKPSAVRRFFPEQEILSYTDGVAAAIQAMELDPRERNVLLAHQFVSGSRLKAGAEPVVGGLDNVESWVFDPFDYVALGHIHGAQNLGTERLRYCGTPLHYSFSEEKQEKSLTLVELGEKGSLSLSTRPLLPLRRLVTLRGSYQELTRQSFYLPQSLQEQYVQLILTDEEEIPNAVNRLRVIYPRLMQLRYDNTRTQSRGELPLDPELGLKAPLELFSELYQSMNGQDFNEEQRDYLLSLLEEVEGSEA